ncbi:MAG: GPW/gp25 family protein [Lachnospiraceae bacterium]|nr:GPW/gp25 family protein [Lachnospiraceae bacterium]
MTDATLFLGKGFQFPPKVDATTGRFVMSEGEEDINEAIYLILKTRLEERPMCPEFGCDIEGYVFDLPDARAERGIEDTITIALTKWEPRIDNIQVTVNKERIQEGILLIEIGYTVRKNNNAANLVFPYYLEEGFSTWR